jgi:hypothetical protein
VIINFQKKDFEGGTVVCFNVLSPPRETGENHGKRQDSPLTCPRLERGDSLKVC